MHGTIIVIIKSLASSAMFYILVLARIFEFNNLAPNLTAPAFMPTASTFHVKETDGSERLFTNVQKMILPVPLHLSVGDAVELEVKN
jgi:hypothetical protein